jgi:hypothetical protein
MSNSGCAPVRVVPWQEHVLDHTKHSLLEAQRLERPNLTIQTLSRACTQQQRTCMRCTRVGTHP